MDIYEIGRLFRYYEKVDPSFSTERNISIKISLDVRTETSQLESRKRRIDALNEACRTVHHRSFEYVVGAHPTFPRNVLVHGYVESMVMVR